MSKASYKRPLHVYGRKALDVWLKLEGEGLKISEKLQRSSKLQADDAAKVFSEAKEYSTRLAAALAAAKVQKDSLVAWVSENLD